MISFMIASLEASIKYVKPRLLTKSRTETVFMSNNIRVFIALPLPEAARELLNRHIAPWHHAIPFQRFVHPEDWHITLHFIGDIAPVAVNAIERAMAAAAAQSRVLRLRLDGLDYFGKEDRPSVLWSRLEGDREQLAQLHQALGDALSKETGYIPEKRPFTPHVTIARKYTGLQPCSSSMLGRASAAFRQQSTLFAADRLVLYRTRLGQTPMYEQLFSSSLPYY